MTLSFEIIYELGILTETTSTSTLKIGTETEVPRRIIEELNYYLFPAISLFLIDIKSILKDQLHVLSIKLVYFLLYEGVKNQYLTII